VSSPERQRGLCIATQPSPAPRFCDALRGERDALAGQRETGKTGLGMRSKPLEQRSVRRGQPRRDPRRPRGRWGHGLCPSLGAGLCRRAPCWARTPLPPAAVAAPRPGCAAVARGGICSAAVRSRRRCGSSRVASARL